MATKPGAKSLTILEQIIEDDVSGLIIQFERMAEDRTVIRLFSTNIPCGNRVLTFDFDGHFIGGGTYTRTCPRPTFIKDAN